jgi:hypothetical protein
MPTNVPFSRQANIWRRITQQRLNRQHRRVSRAVQSLAESKQRLIYTHLHTAARSLGEAASIQDN